MKHLVFCAILFLQFSAKAQVYINLEIVDGVSTFQSEFEVSDKQIGDLHALTIAWLEETFTNQDVLTLNTKTKVAAKYTAHYTINFNQTAFKHDLTIDLQAGKVLFTITDKSLQLVHADGDWKKHLAELRVKFEKGCNEHSWSYKEYIKTHEGKNDL